MRKQVYFICLFIYFDQVLNPSSPSSWSPMSMQWMSGLPSINVVDRDVMHPVSQVPVHLAHINNTCTVPDSTCTLLTSSVTENIYNNHIAGDNPFYPLAAVEVFFFFFTNWLFCFCFCFFCNYLFF